MLDSLSELSRTRRIDLDARLQDLQIEPSRVDVQPGEIPTSDTTTKIDAEMMSFESLRHNEDEQHEDFADHLEPPMEMDTSIEVLPKIQFPDPDKPEPLANRLCLYYKIRCS